MSSETPQVYTSQDLSLIFDLKSSILNASNKVSSLYGINQSLIASGISASIAEEFHDRHETLTDTAKQLLADIYIHGAQNNRLLASIAAVDANPSLVTTVTPVGKLTSAGVSLIDIGPGNIQLYTAVKLLDEYALQNSNSDPLSIKQYIGNPKQLVTARVARTRKTKNRRASIAPPIANFFG